MNLDPIEKRILEEIVEEIEDELYGCGGACFESALDGLPEESKKSIKIEDKVKSLINKLKEECKGE